MGLADIYILTILIILHFGLADIHIYLLVPHCTCLSNTPPGGGGGSRKFTGVRTCLGIFMGVREILDFPVFFRDLTILLDFSVLFGSVYGGLALIS